MTASSAPFSAPRRSATWYSSLASAIAAAAATLTAAAADAQVIGGYVNGTQRTDGGQVVGASFTGSGQTIGALGFYDHGGDGLAASYQVGIWDATSQMLLASTTVTPSSPLIGDFRYATIPPVTLGSPQSFTIGALLPANLADVWIEATAVVLGVGYTGAGTGQFLTSASLVYPAAFDDAAYYVVNAIHDIPEPGTMALGAIGACGALLASRRRRKSNR